MKKIQAFCSMGKQWQSVGGKASYYGSQNTYGQPASMQIGPNPVPRFLGRLIFSVQFMNKIQGFGSLCKRWQSVGGEASHYGSHFLLLGLFFGQSRNKKKAE